MLREIALEDGTVVRTLNQTKGRGQRGANWFFEKDKSLAISTLKTWPAQDQPNLFQLQWVITFAVFEVLRHMGSGCWHIKWPNDIMADDKKIGGILIEHQFKGLLKSSVIGIGINVNNATLPGLPQATSLRQVLGHDSDLEALSKTLGKQVYWACQGIKAENFQLDLARFNHHLYLKNKVAKFQNDHEGIFEGRIKQVDEKGRLLIQTSKALKSYTTGEIKLLR